MNLFIAACLTLGLIATSFALAREIRLRKALEKLLSIILSRWSKDESKRPTETDPLDRTSS